MSLGMLAIPGCRSAASQETAPATNSSLELALADITYVTPSLMEGSFTVSGVLSPKRQVTLMARLAGAVTDLRVQEGESVARGASVARVDAADAQAAAAEKRALVASADAELVAANKNREAQRHLLEAGFVSKAAYDVAEAAYLAKRSAKLAALAQLSLAEALLSHADVRAPSAGIVYRRHTNPGEYVGLGSPIVTLMDPSTLQMVVSVPATEISRVRVGSDCRLTVVGGGGEVIGRVARISPAPDAGTRAFSVYVDVDNRDGRLRIGTFARGQLATERETAQAVLPSGAVRNDGDRDYVLTVEGGRITRHPITVRARDDALSRAAVEPSFDVSTPIVLTRHERIREGQEVTLAGRLP
jgi:RND family efflux transporter MFP subunit